VDTLSAAAARAGARGAPESAAGFLRRALAEPPQDAAVEAHVRAELGLALAAHVHPEAPSLLREAVNGAASAEQRAELALRGARALALGGHFPDAIELCRRALREPAATPAPAVARLEAELVATAFADAATVPEARQRLRRPLLDPSPLELWRVNAAIEATNAGRPAAATLALLRPALGALEAERDSLLGVVALFVLIANEELDAHAPHASTR
jgi:hypothetical protein